jgi:hypothetical protein
LAAGIIKPVSLEMDEESEDELEGMAMEGQHQMHPAAAGGGGSGGGGLLGPAEELRAQRFALLRDLWATAG